ncbi:hypothetical protein H6G89_23650 [Oscillatoria sp. FACHB-1407]|uniref:hypothetical protein n=1 Tax=Oscillatoria sp. FACHB-1407 TaxID=2692847 RepID=UPI00168273F5|nr:hypothetical protein [Oscillatoria sp. FACHB-1407]MBD2464002.1 hypothetical protein [Oscillatoria sp. FACHB-1407]
MTSRQQLDVIIVAVYLISVAYVLYRAYQSISEYVEEQTIITFDKAGLDSQLAERQLKDVIDVNFGFGGRYTFDQPQDLGITVANKSKDKTLEIDWDRCSIQSDGRSRRVIRFPPDRRVDLSQRQVFSVIPPGGVIRERVSAEDLLKVNANNALEPKGPLVTIAALPPPAKAAFLSSTSDIKFSMRLAVWIADDVVEDRPNALHMLNCQFSIKRVPLSEYLPWKR